MSTPSYDRLVGCDRNGNLAPTALNTIIAATRAALPERVGTGQPNGVVTADVGTYYTDTAGTAGAWRWLKTSGNGTNTGWTVIFGDTNRRKVFDTAGNNAWSTSFTDSGATLSLSTGGFVAARRENSMVSIEFFAYNKSAAGSVTSTGSIPVGYRPVTPVVTFLGTTTTVLVRVYLDTAGNFQYYSSGASNSLTGTLTYFTRDAWPTSLPGIGA